MATLRTKFFAEPGLCPASGACCIGCECVIMTASQCTTAGGTYTFAEIRDGLAAAGFERVRLIREDDDRMAGLVEAFNP